MTQAFTRIILQVPALAPAVADLQLLLGRAAIQNTLVMGNTWLELREDPAIAAPAIVGLVLATDVAIPRDTRGLILEAERDAEPASADAMAAALAGGDISKVDHVVLQTRDADDCIRLFQRDLGIRLALDKQAPQWGGRMLFFRAGKLTLEVIENSQQLPASDTFWGIAYTCRDLAASCARLDASGIVRSAIRQGRKPGTLVATVKSHNLGIPTLLLGPE